MKISIVIPTYNHCNDLLKPCIDSIIKYTDFNDIEIIISANGCTDNTKEYVESLGEPFKLIWNEEAIGFSKANNVAIEQSKGEYIVLLNNDILLLEQKTNAWLDMLIKPFDDLSVGITGPLKGPSGPAGRDFIIFFCCMIKREVFDKIGLLDIAFGVGGGEDTDFCIKAEDAGYKVVQVPSGSLTDNPKFMIGAFPIYHKGEGTMHDPNCVQGWDDIFNKNSRILAERYNHQWKLGNECERAVIGKDDPVPPREHTRYSWARANLVGKKVLEIGCSSGYGWRYLKDIEGIDYLGIDKDEGVIKFAKDNFGDRFQVADINTFPFEQYDTIVAFEVLEHIDSGKEMAQKLKKHCKCLLATVPFSEVPGRWGKHHKLFQLTNSDFPDFDSVYVGVNGNITNEPDHFEGLNLLLMKWEEGKSYEKPVSILKEGVTAVVSTKNRYNTTLPLVVLSIINQSHKVDKIIIFDDGDHKDLREDPLWKNIFSTILSKEIEWEVIFTEGKGQVPNHQKSIDMCNTEWIWRLDDDNYAEYDVLEKLLSAADDSTGAVGGLVLDPKMNPNCELASNKIEDIYLGLNIQWFKHEGISEVDHLYSTFIYRKEAAKHGYCRDLSVVGHREETIFIYEMKRAGWKIKVNPDAVTWHYRNSDGGIRTFNDPKLWAWDDSVLSFKMKQWGVIPRKPKIVVLDSGLGDHLAFLNILPELKKKYKDIIIAQCYPEVFKDETSVKLISIDAAKAMGDIDKYSVYKFMWDNNWKKSMVDAYRRLYL